MSIPFAIKEGLSGFKRARLASFITITSIGFALLLIGYFLLFSTNIKSWVGQQRARMEMEVFLENTLSAKQGQTIAAQIKALNGVRHVAFISKAQAAKRFEKEFGRNVFDVLDSNPLPPSVTVRLAPEYQTSGAFRKLEQQISKIDGVDEIVYQRDLLFLMEKYVNWIYLILGGFGLVLLIIAIILLHNTIRLTIFARREIIEIMNLVGATSGFIKRPFLVEGFIQGLIGALIADALLYGSVRLVRSFLFSGLTIRYEEYFVLAVLGILIGLISSKLSVSKYLSRI